MKSTIAFWLSVMLFANNAWAVYGVGVLPRANGPTICEDCHSGALQNESSGTISFETPVLASSPAATALESHASSMFTPPAASSIDDGYTHSSDHKLSAGAKVGIAIGVFVSLLLIALLLIGIPYIQDRRRTRDMQRAVEEVERGTEIRNAGGSQSEAFAASKDNMVLESRVEIVVGDDESTRDMVASWDGWNATWDEEEEELERGRKGMSLPRRLY